MGSVVGSRLVCGLPRVCHAAEKTRWGNLCAGKKRKQEKESHRLRSTLSLSLSLSISHKFSEMGTKFHLATLFPLVSKSEEQTENRFWNFSPSLILCVYIHIRQNPFFFPCWFSFSPQLIQIVGSKWKHDSWLFLSFISAAHGRHQNWCNFALLMRNRDKIGQPVSHVHLRCLIRISGYLEVPSCIKSTISPKLKMFG